SSPGEWGAFAGDDITFTTATPGIAIGGNIQVLYDIPDGRTLYINQMSFSCAASNDADKDNNQMVRAVLTKIAPLPSESYVREAWSNHEFSNDA
ncbi:unnamed protein product, partial [marine sediment metagenome]